MPGPIFYDTETCGLHGPTVLIQWAEGDGEIHLHHVWNNPVHETLALIEKIMTHPEGVVGFNLAFDQFHLCQTYTTLLHLNPDAYPEDEVEAYARAEPIARDGPCLKPVKACDLMLHARRGPYQSTMDRGDIRIRRIPTPLAWQLAQELERRIPFPDIYFARRKNKFDSHWKVHDITDSEGEMDPNFKDIVLTFAPSSALKALAADALNLEPDAILLFTNISVPKEFMPVEYGYAPFALAVGSPKDWKGAWPQWINQHCDHWEYHKLAREYAAKDVELTRELYKYFSSPELGDDDSELACMVAAVRWKGYKVDIPALKALKQAAFDRIKNTPVAPAQAKKYVQALMTPEECLVMAGSTKKVVLEEIATWGGLPCAECDGEGCVTCNKTGYISHPAAARAKEVVEARQGKKEIELYDKLLKAGRFHASFKIIGALSSRMSGADGLNPQGIKKTKTVRRCFPLAWDNQVLSGGDFEGFEVVLAEATYNDPQLREDLLSGKKIHALFGQFVYPTMNYDQILATQGTSDDKYTKAKSAVFAMFYGGEGFTLKERLGVPIEVADGAFAEFCRRYPGVGIARQRVIKMFQTLRQDGGIGTQITYTEPADYIESMFGFRRYFTLENRVCRALVDLASKPPTAWKDIKIKVTRRDRMQTALGATQSALYGAAFALQASNMRAGANHFIQSSGATITKHVQRKIWGLQPAGINSWCVQPMNIHDEIMVPTDPKYAEQVKEIVDSTVESFRPTVPLIKMAWEKQLNSWADK